MHATNRCGKLSLLFIGILLIGLGSGIFISFESFYDSILNYGVQFFISSSLASRGWNGSPPIETNVYLFNWTNPDSIRNVSVKPEFEEVGPYTFNEIKRTANVSWFDHYVNYTSYTESHFNQTAGGRRLSDVINLVNTVVLTLGYQTKLEGRWGSDLVDYGITDTNSELYVTKTVQELLLDGYTDPTAKIVSKIPFMYTPAKGGLLYGKNAPIGLGGTNKYSIHFKNDDRFGEVLLWNGKNRTNFFSGHCNEVKGSAGDFFPLNRKRDQIVIFSADLCKYLVLEYVEDVILKGVHGYKYSAEYGLDNGTRNSENGCFCNGECIPTGVFNASSCRMGSPSFLSFPHFYNADPQYRAAVRGMKPNKTRHEFYMILEPKSGILMEVQAPLQLNMLLRPDPRLHLFDTAQKMLLPIFYVVHKMELTDELASTLKLIQNLPSYSPYFFYTLLSIGSLCIYTALYMLIYCNKKWKLQNMTKKHHYNKIVNITNLYEEFMSKEKSDIK